MDSNEGRSSSVTAVINVLAMPLGSVVAYAGLSDPPPDPAVDGGAQWMICDGRALPRSDYSSLFNVIGTSFGNGSANNSGIANAFNLPDLRGLFIRGADVVNGRRAGNDPDVSSRTAMMPGGNTDVGVGSVQADALQGHRHTMSLATSGSYERGWGVIAGSNSDRTGADVSPYAAPPSVNEPAAFGGYGGPRLSTETRPKNAALNFIIRVR